ncbi:MAG TPA: hypothetical protein VFV39_00260 [Limnobacter sp.]|nr:hypothetical protein [Limnobacter sp.]
MRFHSRTSFLFLGLLALAGCASTSRQTLDAQAKPHVKRIALFQVSEPKRYLAEPEELTAGYLLYAFGALGSALWTGIETLRHSAATDKLHTALSPHQPALADQFETHLKSQLRAKGYQVDLVDTPPKSNTGEGYDLRDLAMQYDAFLSVDMMAGYVEQNGVSSPHVQVHATLMASPSSEVLLKSPYVYSVRNIENVPRVHSNEKFSLQALDDAANAPQLALDGLREGARQVAQLVAEDL